MARWTIYVTLGLVWLALPVGSSAFGQPYPYGPYQPTNPSQRPAGYNPYSRPTLSPYLNLLRGGNPAANYYLGVVPEVERRNQEYRVNRELTDLERRTLMSPEFEDILPTLPQTGHPTGFMYYNPYFSGGTMLTSSNSLATTGAGASSRTPGQPNAPRSRGR
jgi:hypothetical protein